MRWLFENSGKKSKGKSQAVINKTGSRMFLSNLFFSSTYQIPTPAIDIMKVQSSAPVLNNTGNNKAEERIRS